MKIYLDVMGGDNAPQEIIKGAVMAKRDKNYDIILVGDEDIIKEELSRRGEGENSFEILHAPEVIDMSEDPIKAVRSKRNSSIVLGCKEIKGKDDCAFVSAGSTGAILAGASMFAGRIKGVKRPALGVVLYGVKPVLLMDNGANTEFKAQHLLEFAKMGSLYMQKVMNVASPQVALANNGTEESKGAPLYKEAHALLKEKADNFLGNIEMKDLFAGKADIIVCDGFTGNMILKTAEGSLKFAVSTLKSVLKQNAKNLVAGALIKKDLEKAFASFDPSNTGGVPLFGIDGAVFKAHGSSDALAIKNAIIKAAEFVESGFLHDARETFAAMKESDAENAE
ncbi:MAG: phosphate acyltransferase PlsX [Anaerofustis stercorihominis]|nr:phosphate acyltransferase PlsX [Anaerofustis stercorihominis]